MQISPYIHAVKIPFQIPVSPEVTLERFVYSYVIGSIAGSKKICLIDSGVAGSESIIFDTVNRSGNAPSDIDLLLLTHSHPDHIGAANIIKEKSGCSVQAHPAGKEWIEHVDKQFSERPVPGFHTLVGGSVGVDRELSDRETVEFGEISLQIIFTPGHSKCSVSLFADTDGILFTGDAIPQANDLPIYDDAHLAVESIKQLKKIRGVKTLLSSWSDPSYDEDPYDIMDRGMQYFQNVHTTVRKVSKGQNDIDPMVLCSDVVAALGLPEIAVNHLVARSLYSHMKFIDNEIL